MASVICEELIRNVTNSDLEYKMNQTPYTLFFSIRKKFNKNSNFGVYSGTRFPLDLQKNCFTLDMSTKICSIINSLKLKLRTK